MRAAILRQYGSVPEIGDWRVAEAWERQATGSPGAKLVLVP